MDRGALRQFRTWLRPCELCRRARVRCDHADRIRITNDCTRVARLRGASIGIANSRRRNRAASHAGIDRLHESRSERVSRGPGRTPGDGRTVEKLRDGRRAGQRANRCDPTSRSPRCAGGSIKRCDVSRERRSLARRRWRSRSERRHVATGDPPRGCKRALFGIAFDDRRVAIESRTTGHVAGRRRPHSIATILTPVAPMTARMHRAPRSRVRTNRTGWCCLMRVAAPWIARCTSSRARPRHPGRLTRGPRQSSLHLRRPESADCRPSFRTCSADGHADAARESGCGARQSWRRCAVRPGTLARRAAAAGAATPRGRG